MRAVLFVIIIAIVAVVAALATGLLNIRQLRGGEPAQVSASGNGVTAGGAPPAFEVQTGSVKVGTTDAHLKVKVPKLQVMRPGNDAEATTNNSM
jgi:hypothetical protein